MTLALYNQRQTTDTSAFKKAAGDSAQSSPNVDKLSILQTAYAFEDKRCM